MNNLYLIIGTDTENLDFNIYNILKNIKYNEENKITYDLSESTLSDILDEASMMSLIDLVKVIIGNNLDIAKIDDVSMAYLSKYVDNYNKDVYIILIAPKVDARIKNYSIFKNKFNVIDLNKITEKDNLINYIDSDVKSRGYKLIDTEYFLSRVGNDIHNINLELEKLYIYKENDKTITRDDIDKLIADNIDNVIYEFTNAFLENDLDKLTKMYQNFKLQNITNDYLISSLINTLHQVLIIKLMNSEGKSNLDISKKIGKKEFYVKKMLERTYPYSIDDISGYIDAITKIDLNFKSGKANYDELELFLIERKRDH